MCALSSFYFIYLLHTLSLSFSFVFPWFSAIYRWAPPFVLTWMFPLRFTLLWLVFPSVFPSPLCSVFHSSSFSPVLLRHPTVVPFLLWLNLLYSTVLIFLRCFLEKTPAHSSQVLPLCRILAHCLWAMSYFLLKNLLRVNTFILSSYLISQIQPI